VTVIENNARTMNVWNQGYTDQPFSAKAEDELLMIQPEAEFFYGVRSVRG
jgi:hypothetical protein